MFESDIPLQLETNPSYHKQLNFDISNHIWMIPHNSSAHWLIEMCLQEVYPKHAWRMAMSGYVFELIRLLRQWRSVNRVPNTPPVIEWTGNLKYLLFICENIETITLQLYATSSLRKQIAPKNKTMSNLDQSVHQIF